VADSVEEAEVSAAAALEVAGNMKHAHFLKKLDEYRVIGALHHVEQETSARIELFISHEDTVDPVATAQKKFNALNLEKSPQRNNVLFFIAPKSQKFAVIGDKAVHEKCGQSFWDELASILGSHFKKHEFTIGLITGIEKAGALLARHFPRDKNAAVSAHARILED
jgi:hypothetical protein